MSTNSGGRGPLRVGISPVSACSMLARLIGRGVLCSGTLLMLEVGLVTTLRAVAPRNHVSKIQVNARAGGASPAFLYDTAPSVDDFHHHF